MERRRQRYWGMPEEQREPLGARISLLLLLFNIFIWVGLRNVDVLLVSLGSCLVALAGMLLGRRVSRQIRRKQGRMRGEAMAGIGYWGNLMLFLVTGFLFAFSLTKALLRGDIL